MRDNRGVTLVELIVALLILSIIVVPLMGMFTGAARTNSVTNQRSDADTVAENILEALKVFGVSGEYGLTRQISEFDPAVERKSRILGMKCTSVDSSVTGGNTYKYTLSGISEGTQKNLKAVITLTESTTGERTVRKTANFVAFDVPKMVGIINPVFCTVGNDPSRYVDDEALNNLWNEYQSSITGGTTDVIDFCKNYVNKTTTIRVEPEYVYEPVGHVVYKVYARMKYEVSGLEPYEKNVGSTVIEDIETQNKLSIFLTYTPYPFITRRAFSSTGETTAPWDWGAIFPGAASILASTSQKIELVTTEADGLDDKIFDFYIVVQDIRDSTVSGSETEPEDASRINIACDSNSITVYSNVGVQLVSRDGVNTYGTSSASGIVNEREEPDTTTTLDVTINIIDEDKNEVVRTISATVVQ